MKGRKLLTSLSILLICIICQAAVPLPVVPDSLRQPSERADYILLHFWDPVRNLNEYAAVEIEQAFVDFISVFPHSSSESIQSEAFDNLMLKVLSSDDAFNLVYGIADKYLYTLDSPIYSGDLYILFLNSLINNVKTDENLLIRPRWQLSEAMKNRPGSPASDFTFTTREGTSSSLSIVVKSLPDACARLILVFYDPDCEHCAETIHAMSNDADLNARIGEGAISVLAIYSGDEKDLWENSAFSLPSSWIVGYDEAVIYDENIYAIRSLPSIYIIGNDMKVISKEVAYPDISF